MLTLTIDTSTVSVIALVDQDAEVRRSPDSRHHAETLAPLINELVGDRTPDRIVAGTGPAAFTGLRAGLVTARALARAWNIPLIGIGSLDILGRSGLDRVGKSGTPNSPVIAVGDARRKEVYAQVVTARGNDDLDIPWGPEVLTPQALAERYPDATFVGPGAVLYSDILKGAVNEEIDPLVMVRLANSRLARVDSGEELDLGTEPLYLRRPDIHGA